MAEIIKRNGLEYMVEDGIEYEYIRSIIAAPPLDPKEAKIAELSAACNATILGGFTSAALGDPHDYDFDYEAQTNLGGMLNAITAGIVTTEPIQWKASGVPTDHTFTQFKQLYADGLVFKNTQIQRYWTLKEQVSAATTQAEIDAITWE